MTIHRIKNYFDQQAQMWDTRCRYNEAALQRIVAVCDLAAGQRVADVACGTGVLFPYLLQHDPVQLVGIDISTGMAEIAQEKHHDARLLVLAQDFLDTNETGFDRVVLHNAYPHFPDKERLSQKICEVLARGGRFTVAHSIGRAQVNDRHRQGRAAFCSTQLGPCEAERKWFSDWAHIDVCEETQDYYIISGTK